jgi:PAS domain S-box-containing protein
MIAKLRNVSLRTQLTLVIFIASLIVILLTSMLFIYWKVEDARGEAKRISQTAVTILAQDFVRSILLGKPDIAVDMASKIEAFDSISNAEFLTQDHVPVLVYNRPGQPEIGIVPVLPEQVQVGANNIGVYTPIVYQGKTYGIAYFRFHYKLFNAELIAFIKRLAVTLPVLLLLSIPLALYLQRVVSRPIHQLARALAEFGQHKATVMLEGDARPRELRALFDGFNNMTRRIEHAQTQLAEQKERLLVTLESIADGVIATNEQGIITYMNPAAEYITGWDEAAALGQNADAVYRLIDEQTEKPLSGHIDETLLSGTVHFNLENTVLLTKQDNKLAIRFAMRSRSLAA